MATIILGKSFCPICGEILLEGEDILGLPAFCDPPHQFHEFSDAGYHVNCFINWHLREEVETLIELSKEAFQRSEYFLEMLKKFGPPTYLADQFVEVINSFELTDSKIIVFLKWGNGQLANGTILDSLDGESWIVKQYLWTTSSDGRNEEVSEDEKTNIFQYLLQPIVSHEKPKIRTFLRIQNSA